MPEQLIRTRFAPSPTGFMHVGNLRTALFEYLVAKSQQGRFILRIEDTDQERQVEGALDIIYQTLERCGLKHDEGPDIGGPCAPYVQSERLADYRPVAERLINEGHAYYCFCTAERLDALKAKNPHAGYDRHCRDLSQAEISRLLASGTPYVIRQKMPLRGETHFQDSVYGDIAVNNEELEDQILLKSDGFPTYNFANVVDDHAMGITHVVRGCEYLSSTPKYNLLYEALGYEIPTYIHLPLILGPDGQKLSKRHGATGFCDLVAEGYLPEAIINYIALLGWSPEGTKEVFSLTDLCAAFSIAGISKSPAVFDYNKLRWFNQEYFKAMTLHEFTRLCQPYFESVLPARRESGEAAASHGWDFPLLASLLQPRLERLADIPAQIAFLADFTEDYDLALFTHKKMKTRAATAAPTLDLLLARLDAVPAQNWTQAALHDLLLELAHEHGLKNGQIMWPCRVAVSGQAVTPGGAVEILFLLGREESLRRLRLGLRRLRADFPSSSPINIQST